MGIRLELRKLGTTLLLTVVEEEGGEEEERWAQQEHEQVDLERQPQRQFRNRARRVPNVREAIGRREGRQQARELKRLEMRGIDEMRIHVSVEEREWLSGFHKRTGGTFRFN